MQDVMLANGQQRLIGFQPRRIIHQLPISKNKSMHEV